VTVGPDDGSPNNSLAICLPGFVTVGPDDGSPSDSSATCMPGFLSVGPDEGSPNNSSATQVSFLFNTPRFVLVRDYTFSKFSPHPFKVSHHLL